MLKKIRLFIYQSGQPFSIIENEAFKNLFEFDLITVDSLCNTIKQDFTKMLFGIQKEIDKSLYVSLILDEWKFHGDSFIGITAFLTGMEVEFNSIVLSLSIPTAFDRTSETISSEIKNQLNKFQFNNKIITSVTDCAAVMRKAVNVTGIEWVPCLSHIIHNSVKHMLNSVKTFNNAMLHANEISKDYRFKQYLSAQFRRKKNLQMFNDTRWLSRFKTCHDIVELFTTMKHYEASINRLIRINNEEKNLKLQEYVCPVIEEDYNICLTLHDPLFKLSELVLKFQKCSHDNVFYALFWIESYTRNIKCDLQRNGLGNCAIILENYLIKKLKKYHKLAENIAVGALLNPNLEIENRIDQNNPFFFVIQVGKEKIKSSIKTPQNIIYQYNGSDEIGMRKKRLSVSEYEKWLSSVEPLEDEKEESVYRYWKNNTAFPKLRDLALRISSAPTSSTDCERLFSIADYVIGNKRCNMTKENIEMSVLLYANYQIAKREI